MRSLLRFGYYPVGLMAELPGQLAVLPLHLFGRQQFLFISRPMRGDLACRRAVDSLLALVVFHLLAARTRRLHILLRVAPDLRLAVLAPLQLVTELLEPRGQFRTVDRRAVVLRGIQLMGLHGAGLAVLPLGHVEDHGMGVELGRGIAIDRPRRVVLEGRGHELARGLRGMDIPYPRLGIVLDFTQSYANALPVGFPHPLIASYQRGQRDGLRRGKRRIPPGPVLHARHFLAALALVSPGYLVPNKLVFSRRMLAFAQPGELLITNRAL